MNKTYLYDGAFSSLQALIYILINGKYVVDDIKSEYDYTYNLLDKPVYLNIIEKEEKVIKLKKLLTLNILKTIKYIYLSNDNDKEMVIYKFIKVAITYKNKVYYMRNLDVVNKAYKLSHRVTMEAHKLKGFLRFKQLKNDVFYAEINPTNNIISLLVNHFKERLSNERWVIKDVNRNLFALYDLNKVIYLKGDSFTKLNLVLNADENIFEDLWKTFFNTIAIKERENKKCQMNFMPKKYWNYIIEVSENNEDSN